MPTLFFLVLAFMMMVPAANCGATSDEAMKLRVRNGLSEFSPPEPFLNANFVADEVEPHFIFGKVKDFVRSRSCSSTWLIEESEKNRLKQQESKSTPMEYTLFLEEDCPGKIAYYVFVDRSFAKSVQWFQWRQQFHGKSKAESLYSSVVSSLEGAEKSGFPVGAELRFIEVEGDLILKKTEDYLVSDLKVRPVYDMNLGKSVP